MHRLVEEAFRELYPGREVNFDSKIVYSRAFKGYNAKVRYTKSFLEFRISHDWKEVSEELQIGLIQSLLNKVFRTSIKTMNMELYEIFLRKIPSVIPKTRSDPLLEDCFTKVNNEYFGGMMTMPNLEFGGMNFRTLGTYDHGTDTIRVSDVLRKDLHLLEYVMYHEMLHKKHKYRQAAQRTIHHSRQFREEEKKFCDPDVEQKLKNFLRREKIRSRFWPF